MKLLKQGAVYCFLLKLMVLSRQSQQRDLCVIQLSSSKGRQSCCARSPRLASATVWCQAILGSRIPLFWNYFSCEFKYRARLCFFFSVLVCSTSRLQVGCVVQQATGSQLPAARCYLSMKNVTKNGSRTRKS